MEINGDQILLETVLTFISNIERNLYHYSFCAASSQVFIRYLYGAIRLKELWHSLKCAYKKVCILYGYVYRIHCRLSAFASSKLRFSSIIGILFCLICRFDASRRQLKAIAFMPPGSLPWCPWNATSRNLQFPHGCPFQKEDALALL